jgi:sulfur carrier protein
MQILINQETFDVPENATLAEALDLYGARPPFAVAVNLSFVHRQQYGETRLRPDDTIEVVQPVAGG